MIRGIGVDPGGRCKHWHGPDDVVATEFPCCPGWWACYQCHDEVQGHKAVPWPIPEHGKLAVLCGACHSRMAIRFVLAGDDACPHCRHPWNPACREHRHHYFRP